MVKKIELGKITVDVVQKDIKNIHLSVYPPTGKVRISAPLRLDLDTIRVFAISKLGWIKHYQSLAAAAQQHGVAIGKLNGLVNPGHTGAINDARTDFADLTKEIIKRTGI